MLNHNKILSEVHVASPAILNGFIIFTVYRPNIKWIVQELLQENITLQRNRSRARSAFTTHLPISWIWDSVETGLSVLLLPYWDLIKNLVFSSMHFCPVPPVCFRPHSPAFHQTILHHCSPLPKSGKVLTLPCGASPLPTGGKGKPGQHTWNPDRVKRGFLGREVAQLSEKDALHRGLHIHISSNKLLRTRALPVVGSKTFLLQNLHFLTTRSLDQARGDNQVQFHWHQVIRILLLSKGQGQ